MSIESLTTGDTVVKQTATHTMGAAGGDVPTFSDAATLTCLVQTPGSSESRGYAARGLRLTHKAFFSADPTLTTNDRLKWTSQGDVALSPVVYLRVIGMLSQGRPGATLLWIADLEQVTTRPE